MHDSWTHLLARAAIRPLLGTFVRPNHLTTLRLLTGLAACLLFALGTRQGDIWGGVVWLFSAFLDRADGELARIGKMTSPAGHHYDYVTDVLVNALFFVAIGVGLRHSVLGIWAVPLGLISGAALALCSFWSEQLEAQNGHAERAYSGRWGFDPDDALYLMAPFAWLGWLVPILVGASMGTTVMMTITFVRLRRLQLPTLARGP
jgi:archaetidylinositol phosphate synthase